jgi:hypothetical protein
MVADHFVTSHFPRGFDEGLGVPTTAKEIDEASFGGAIDNGIAAPDLFVAAPTLVRGYETVATA